MVKACHMDPTSGHVGVRKTMAKISDKVICKGFLILNGSWLNDCVINGAQILLHNLFPWMGGFKIQLNQQPSGLMLWIDRLYRYFMSAGHWITVSNVGCEEGTINVFDSLHFTPSRAVKHLVAHVVKSKSAALTFRS